MPPVGKIDKAGRTQMKGSLIVVAILMGLMVLGILAGDFTETWRNGATL